MGAPCAAVGRLHAAGPHRLQVVLQQLDGSRRLARALRMGFRAGGMPPASPSKQDLGSGVVGYQARRNMAPLVSVASNGIALADAIRGLAGPARLAAVASCAEGTNGVAWRGALIQ